MVDFSSSALLGLDDAALKQEILDTFMLDALTSTFTLTPEVTLYDGPVPVSDSVTAFVLAFSSGTEIDPYNPIYAHVDGPGTVGGGIGTVPAPLPLYPLLSVLPLFVFSRRRLTAR